jgi:uncharacterized integral membrane protein
MQLTAILVISEERDMKMQKSQILFISSLIFAITNSELVTINLFFQNVIASQALVIIKPFLESINN